MRFLLVVAFSLVALTAAAQPSTPAPPADAPPPTAPAHAPPSAQVIAARHAARQACAADAAKLCADAVAAAGGKVIECLRQHRTDVSASCSQALDAIKAAREASPS